MSKIFDKLFFMGPSALGDNIVLSGLVHYYADRANELHLPVWSKHYDTMRTLYQDHTHIKVKSVTPTQDSSEFWREEAEYVDQNKLSRILRPELIHSTIKGYSLTPMWDLQIYSMHDLSYEIRYRNFRMPKFVEGAEELYQRLSNNQPYVLVHNRSGDHPDGYPIDIAIFRKHNNMSDINIIEIDESITNNFMQYSVLIERAQEIHCVPSSFHCLVDSMKTDARLFFHDIREKTAMVVNSRWNNHRWHIVNYASRI